MDPAFPNIVMQRPAGEDRLDERFLDALGSELAIDEIVDALIIASAEQEIAESRIW